MMSDGRTLAGESTPALPHMALDGDGSWRLTGTRCGACGVLVEGERLACPGCGERHRIDQVRLGTSGRVHSATLVHRSYPGVTVPFCAVVVDLDGGGTVRGTLAGIAPDADMPIGARVTMAFGDSGQRDRLGRMLIAYRFERDGEPM